MQGRTMPTGSPLLRLFGEPAPAADLRTGAHPHVVFRWLAAGLVSLQVRICRPLMKWISGTKGPKCEGGIIPWEEKCSQGLCGRLRLASTHRAARASLARAVKDAAELVATVD